MINRGQDIEKLVQQTFRDFEPDVHPDVWMNIQQSLTPMPQPSSSGPGGSSASGKVSGLFSKLNTVAVISASVALTGIVAGFIYFTSEEPKATKENPEKNSIISEPLPSLPGEITAENTVAFPQEASSISFNNSPQPGNSISLNTIASGEENLNHEKFSANDFIEPARKEELNKVPMTELAAPEHPAIPDYHPDNPLLIGNKDITDQENENINAAPESEPESPTVSEFSTEIIEKASLGIITNVITPNSDNKNDVFVINGYGLKSLRVSISNNSGKIVHQWNNLHGFWDGKLENGSNAEPGIYFYDIFAESKNGNPLVKNGSFVLRR